MAHETVLAPGERHRFRGEAPHQETAQFTVNQALAEHQRLVVLGDPGSGKATLLRYLALRYARDLADGTQGVEEKLDLTKSKLPIFLPLRQLRRFLVKNTPDDGTEGHAVLLRFFTTMLKNERMKVPTDFFDEWLNSGSAVILLDGLDEVAEHALRRRVARLVDAFLPVPIAAVATSSAAAWWAIPMTAN